MPDEPVDEDAAKAKAEAKALRMEFSKAIESVTSDEKFNSLTFLTIIIDNKTEAVGFCGTWCPVCATTAMFQTILMYNIQHTDPDHDKAIREQLESRLMDALPIDKDKIN